jgi:hypothetical protein
MPVRRLLHAAQRLGQMYRPSRPDERNCKRRCVISRSVWRMRGDGVNFLRRRKESMRLSPHFSLLVISQRSGVNGLYVRPSYHRKNLSASAVICTTLFIRLISLQNHHVKSRLVFFLLHIRLTTPQVARPGARANDLKVNPMTQRIASLLV